MYIGAENFAAFTAESLECSSCGYGAIAGETIRSRCPKCGRCCFQKITIADDLMQPKGESSLATRSFTDVAKAYKQLHPADRMSRVLAFKICKSAEQRLREGLLRIGLGDVLGIASEELTTPGPRFPRRTRFRLPRMARRMRDCIGQMRLF